MKRIVYDGFFHMMPGHRLSRNIATGGYQTNYGRYSPFDVYHPNGSSMLLADLLARYDFKVSSAPYSEMALAEADILLISNPDYPLYEGSAPYRMDAPDIEALKNFLGRGGSVILLINSFLSRSDFWEENFDFERIAPLFGSLDLKWDHDFMSDDMRILPAKSGAFRVGYGQGGRVLNAKLPKGAEPLLRYEGDVFGFRVNVGKGKLAVLGDAGLVSNGLYHFPGFDNAAFLANLFEQMIPAWGKTAAGSFEYFEFGHLSCAPSEQGISEKIFKALRPGARFAVDHHYRHLTHEKKATTIARRDVSGRLPVALKDISGRPVVRGEVPYVNLNDGVAASRLTASLNVSEMKSAIGSDYIISGTMVNENVRWSEVGADPAVFNQIGELVKVSTVVQILAGTDAKGSLRYYTLKQGQICYIKNTRNPHYGYDILIGSRNFTISPTTKSTRK